jgi:formate/nitrite transporter
MAAKAEQVGIRKANLSAGTTLLLAVLAGAFISLGAAFSTTVGAGSAQLPYGIARIAVGVSFCLGLILVVVAGAELFTGNNLIVMAVASRKVSVLRLARNWAIVYAGNFAGALATAGIIFLARQYEQGNGAVGAAALRIGLAKCQLDFPAAFASAVMCNALVCLAVWLTYSARSTADRILAILFPITAFVSAGFEHSVANMYFLPTALFIKAGAAPAFWESASLSPSDFDALTWSRFLVANLLPVTLGNVVGGSGLVGLVYWFVYLRKASQSGK